MLQVLAIVTPFFGLILLGFASVKSGYLSREAARYMVEFAVKLAMPVFLFRAMLSIGDLEGSPTNLVLAYFAGVVCSWLLATLVTWLVLRRSQADAAAISMGATFSNGVMLGVPLAISTFGPEAAAPAALLISLDTPILWIIATLHIESVREGRGGSAFAAIGRIFLDLARNPIVLSLVLGTVARLSGLTLPPLVDKATGLLAQAAIPTMLVALGASIATYKIAGQTSTLVTINLIKIVIFPLITFGFAVYVFELPPLWTAIAVLFAAMPVGANAYLFAAKYDRAVGSVSTSIAISTFITIFTVTALLFWLRTIV
ncbi:MAG: AEC family transporter [Pseudomonadota bacterium]